MARVWRPPAGVSPAPPGPLVPDWSHEAAALAAGHGTVAGCDEVGRGALAGPLVAAAAASIVAKVTRDRLMAGYHGDWPVYGFADHKGYGTAAHLAAIRAHGPSPQHRLSFAPLRRGSADTDEEPGDG